jgi:hypothetical protein
MGNSRQILSVGLGFILSVSASFSSLTAQANPLWGNTSLDLVKSIFPLEMIPYHQQISHQAAAICLKELINHPKRGTDCKEIIQNIKLECSEKKEILEKINQKS